MKKGVILLALFTLGLFSCDNKQKPKDGKSVGDAQISKDFVDEHTARNSLDWMGAYEGTLPCADCEGIKTIIVLNENGTFTLREEYIQRSNLIDENKGKFYWNDSGLIITLEGEDGFKRSFKVVENAIIHLDNEGNEITGELAGHYRLTKK